MSPTPPPPPPWGVAYHLRSGEQSSMSARRKAPPSLATHLGVATDAGIVRVWHPGYIEKLRAQKEEMAGADPVADAGEGRRR